MRCLCARDRTGCDTNLTSIFPAPVHCRFWSCNAPSASRSSVQTTLPLLVRSELVFSPLKIPLWRMRFASRAPSTARRRQRRTHREQKRRV